MATASKATTGVTEAEGEGPNGPFFGIVEEVRGAGNRGEVRVVARCWTLGGPDDADGFHEDFYLAFGQWVPISNTLVRDAGEDAEGNALADFYDNMSLRRQSHWRRFRHVGEGWWEEIKA